MAHVKYADLLRPVMLVRRSATAEFEPGRVLRPCGLRFQIWCSVNDAAPTALQPTALMKTKRRG